MTYAEDLTWTEASKNAGVHARALIFQLTEGLNAYDEWQNFRAARDNATIATALGVAETAIAELDACFAAMKNLYDVANNGVVAQADHLYSLRRFS